jgi:hypothetical protein
VIASEIKNAAAVVRIHDEFCRPAAEQMEELNRVVSAHYKRRLAADRETGTPAANRLDG